MTIERTSWIAAGLMILFSASAFAGFPESCFKSKDDYERYVKYGEEGPPLPDETLEDHEEYERQSDLFSEGPGRMKAIGITVNQSQSAGQIVADASASSTPSGKKAFAWGSSNIVSTAAQYSTKAGAPGTYSNITLTVSDPVCELKAATQVRMTSK